MIGEQLMSDEQNRIESFKGWPLDYIKPKIMAESGLYYLGVDDKVQCFACKVIIHSWKRGDNELEEHSKWSPNCPLISGDKGEDVCGVYDMKSKYCDETVRLQSFARWPKILCRKISQLVHAGFFYTEVGDCVKCFNCAGTLCDWDESDNPWMRHKIRYPHCPFIIGDR